MKISEPMKAETGAVDLWPMWQAMGDCPVAVVRGSISELLSLATAKRMVKALPNATFTSVKGAGHAPMLYEPEAIKAIDTLLASVIKATAK
jgi:pimeloyl-ACP methyl ester carboxylesterase